MVIITGYSVIVSLGLIASIVAVIAQRAKLTEKRSKHWQQEQEIARLSTAVDAWSSDYRRMEAANNRLVDRLLAEQSKPPLVIQPPDVANIVERVGETVALAIYGRQQQDKEDTQRQIKETSMVQEQYKPGEWFPDVEFDPQMGSTPTHGGWVNGESNQHIPPGEGQTPRHAVINGELVRVDGQSMFQAGAGSPVPQGGVE